MSILEPTRAMQGGTIEGADVAEIESSARQLMDALRIQQRKHATPPEHDGQEMASLLIQVLLQAAPDPLAFIEGAMTQMGWQITARSSSGEAAAANARQAVEWFGNGITFAAAEPMFPDPAGRA